MNEQIIIKNSSNDIISNNWVETNNGFYTLLKSNDTYSLIVKNDINSELVMIGGGGAGGYFYGGGGGAGCAYYNDNFNFKKNKKYDFNIGKGGKSILQNMDNIFNGGLELKGYYNYKPALNNFSITDDDVSTLLINTNSMDTYKHPFVIHNIEDLNSLIKITNNSINDKNGYSLLLTGFITVPQDGKYTFHLNSDHLVYIWLDMFLTNYTNDNIFIKTDLKGDNKQYSKDLKAGVFYKIKIFIYNKNNGSNFSLIMKNKKLNINTDITTFKNFVFSLNENNEKYDVIDASPTKLSIDNKLAVNCDGGGIGGYGINNNDKININGGCGGGAGLNKLAGKSTIVNKNDNYYGFDGSAGNNDYTCGGGGGVYSGGYNLNGGEGIKLDWFKDKIGLGGEGAVLNVYKKYEKRNNYGSGGDGGGVFDKEFNLCGKSGKDGCVLIYVKKNLKQKKEEDVEEDIMETFANPVNPNNLNNIFDKYIKDSFIKDSVFTAKNTYDEVNNGLIKCDNDNFVNLYSDCVFFLHLYSSLYSQLENYNKLTVNYDIIEFKKFIKNLKIKLDLVNTGGSNINVLENNTITIYYSKLFATTDNLKSGIDSVNSEVIASTGITEHTPTYTTLSGYSALKIGGTITNITDSDINKKKPILTNITVITDTPSTIIKNYYNNAFNYILGDYDNTFDLPKLKRILTKFNFLELKYITLNREARLSKLLNVLYEIFLTPPENIMGYLLYYKIFYNIIVYNLSIQYSLRYNVINNDASNNSNTISELTVLVKNNINYMTLNIQNLVKLNFQDPTNNDFLKERAAYSSKILLLNDIKKIYTNNQLLLNKSIKNYNDYFKNFEKLKSNAVLAIILLVVLIVVSIIVFASPSFSPTVKQTYNMTANTLLIITTFMYYQNFKDVVTFENFTYNCNTKIADTTYPNIKETIFSGITSSINSYNTEIKNIMNKLRNNIYISGSKSFSNDGNKYLYNLFIEKKQKNEVYKTKRVTVTNLIEALKKQISFLFNIILLVSIVIIIALSAFMAYSLLPEMVSFITFISVVLLIIICAYFINAIVQPTKLVANKNYWANETPTEEYLNEKLL